MHSHEGLQEAFLPAAPLIVHDPSDEPRDEQQIILFLGDFSCTPPTEIYAKLHAPSVSPMAMGGGKMPPVARCTMAKPDANYVDYDAYLANDRTLNNPDVVRVEKNAPLRLRIINGSSGANYFINLGDLQADLIATDGLPVQPISASLFPLAIAKRIGLRLRLPGDEHSPSSDYGKTPASRRESSSPPKAQT